MPFPPGGSVRQSPASSPLMAGILCCMAIAPNRAIRLWLMSWSAKLNLFLGMPNLNDWLPDHLAYLKTYMPRRSMNLLFPVSVTVSTVIVVLMVARALGAETSGAETVGLILVATLLSLGILEHWFLVLPLHDEALWAWALPPREETSASDATTAQPRQSVEIAQGRSRVKGQG